MTYSRVAILSSVHEAMDPRIFHKQARSLAVAGFDVHLLARHGSDAVRGGVRIHALPEPRSRRDRPAQWLRLLWRTWLLRPRVIHIHDPELLPLLLILRWITGAAAIYDAHEYYAEEVARRRWIPLPLRRPAARLTHAVETFVARRIDAVVAVNEHMAAGFRRRGARAVAIHNFPPAEYFALDGLPSAVRHPASGEQGPERDADPQGSRPQRLTPNDVVYVGLLSADRGLATVYEAAGLLREQAPTASVHVIGRVDWSGLSAAVPHERDAWAAAGVALLGTIPAAAVPDALAGAAAGWIPFLDTPNNRRTIPLKLLEYMAAGVPVVASEIGYIARIVRESGCGLLAPPGDAAAHAAALATLLADPARAASMAAAGRRAVRDRYTWAGEGEKLVTLYRSVTGGARSAAAPTQT